MHSTTAKDVIRVATRGYTNGTVKGIRTYLHVNCPCRIRTSLVGTYSTMEEARRAANAELEGTGDYLRTCSKSGLVKARALARPVRYFDTTMRAAGAAWNGAGARDGDVFVIASEGVVGIVIRSAVIAITAERGNLMGLETSAREYRDGLYAEITDRAEAEARKIGAAVNPLHAAPAVEEPAAEEAPAADGPAVHRFADTREAYDTAMCGDVADGDVLVIEAEGVAGFLAAGYPIAITRAHGELHTMEGSARTYKGGAYVESVEAAERAARELGAEVPERHAAPAPAPVTPADVAREDGVTVKRDGANKWIILRGRDYLGVVFDDGGTMARGRYSAWAPYAGTPGNFGGCSDDPAVTVEWIVQAWPTTAGEIAAETGAPLEDVLAAAEAVAEEWGTSRRSVLRIAAAKGAQTKVTGPAAEAVRERLAVAAAAVAEEPAAEAAEEEDPEHCVSILGGKVHEVMPGFDGSDGRPVYYFPLCRTGASTNRGTRYQKTTQELTCTTCLTYQERRRAAREAKAAAS